MSLLTTTTTTDTTTSTSTLPLSKLSKSASTTRLRSPLTSTTPNPSISASAPPQSSLNTYPKTPPRSLRKQAKRLPTSTRSGSGISSKSTPNLGSLFASQAAAPPVPALPSLTSITPQTSNLPPGFPAPLLIRKGSLAALTQSSLATIPDATESYALDTLNEFTGTKDSNSDSTSTETTPTENMAPLTPGRFASSMASYSGAPSGTEDIAVGDEVDVPGGMVGTIRFVGSVNGRKGVFAGVELHPEFATRGKNSGDVDGVSYFNTTLHGAGIFLPLTKAIRRDVSPSAFPMTPSASTFAANGLKLGNQNSTNYTPPTPSIPKFSQSVSGGGPPRAPSPQHRRPPRTSLPRPDSPVRRLQMTPGPPSRPSLSTPAPKASATTASINATVGGGRFGSPTSTSKFSQSMRAPTTSGLGDPAKKGLGMFRAGANGAAASTTNLVPDRSLKASIGPRSVSALGGASNYGDDDAPMPPLGRIPGMPSMPSRPPTNGSGNGSVGSASSFGRGVGGQRPSSRTAGHKKNGSIATATTLANNDEEVERLRTELDDRERQLKDQASTLADMESSLTELQTLIGSSDLPDMLAKGANDNNNAGGTNFGDELDEVKDLSQMRALLREKNDKIAMLTAEFDQHRADFRSTIDTLEMASTETERVYEKKIEEMIQEVQELESRLADVDVVAQQLKQLEELVQELEEGLEDARRGEAEARGEVEFLRGEVERTRTELRREREKQGSPKQNSPPSQSTGNAANGSGPSFKDLEQKDDEIRGLKAIIHSLSQNAGVQDLQDMPKGMNGMSNGMSSGNHRRGESINERLARESLEREVADLRALLATKSTRESEMEQEIETLRVGSNNSGPANGNRASAMTVGSRSSLRDSRGTVVLARDFREAVHGHQRSNSNSNSNLRGASLNALNHNNLNPTAGSTANRAPHHSRGPTLDTMPESDAYSSVTESSTLWCEICETNGHDILTCTNMFGTQAGQHSHTSHGSHTMKSLPPAPLLVRQDTERSGKDIVRAALATTAASTTTSMTITSKPAMMSPEVKILPNPMESGPVAGKESGVVDAGKWCALCERDGHDSVDCPFEDAF